MMLHTATSWEWIHVAMSVGHLRYGIRWGRCALPSALEVDCIQGLFRVVTSCTGLLGVVNCPGSEFTYVKWTSVTLKLGQGYLYAIHFKAIIRTHLLLKNLEPLLAPLYLVSYYYYWDPQHRRLLHLLQLYRKYKSDIKCHTLVW